MKDLLNLVLKRQGRPRVLGLKIERRYVYFAALVSLVTLLVLFQLPVTNSVDAPRRTMVSAGKTMKEATEALREYRDRSDLTIDRTIDPNLTGLIGRERTELTTTLGDLEAKRTTTNPNFAGLMVLLMKEVGVSRGESVAIGASASFPGAIIATLSAVKAIGADPLIIYSLGSSMWGANLKDLTILDMHRVLGQRDIIPFGVNAASLGGEDDIGGSMDKETRSGLMGKIEKSGAKLIRSPSLRDSVKERMELYNRGSGGKVEAFVNIGGAAANMGSSARILQLEPGINLIKDLPPEEKRGVIYEMASKDVPVIHILNVKGLALKYQLPWDPVPLPDPGEDAIFDERENKPLLFWLVFVGYFGVLAPGLVALYRTREEG